MERLTLFFFLQGDMTHLLRISSEHGVYGFDPLEEVGRHDIGGSGQVKKTKKTEDQLI